MKKLGFSLDEIRQMTMTQFMVWTDLAVNVDSNGSKHVNGNQPEPVAPRRATQADIDRLFSF